MSESQEAAVSEYKVVNPATNQTEREFATATDAEIEQVLERSARAYQSWRTTAKDERAKVLLRVAELYKERAGELAALITREMGKPTREAKGEIMLVASIYRYYAEQGPALLADTPLSPRAGGGGAGPQGAHRPAARHHAVELPVLPGGPVRGPEPHGRQYDHSQARAAVPGVGAGHGADLP